MSCCVWLPIVALVVTCRSSDAVAVTSSRRGGAWGKANGDSINVLPLNDDPQSDYTQSPLMDVGDPMDIPMPGNEYGESSPLATSLPQSPLMDVEVPLDNPMPEEQYGQNPSLTTSLPALPPSLHVGEPMDEYDQSPSLTTSMPASLPSLHVGRMTTTRRPPIVQPPVAASAPHQGLNRGVVLGPGQVITPHTTTPKVEKPTDSPLQALRPATEPGRVSVGGNFGGGKVLRPGLLPEPGSDTDWIGDNVRSQGKTNVRSQGKLQTTPAPSDEYLNAEINHLSQEAEALQSTLIQKNDQLLSNERVLRNVTAIYQVQTPQLFKASQDLEQEKLEYKKAQGLILQLEENSKSDITKRRSKLNMRLANATEQIEKQEIRSKDNDVKMAHIQTLKERIAQHMQYNSLEATQMKNDYQSLLGQVAERDRELGEAMKQVKEANTRDVQERSIMDTLKKELAAAKALVQEHEEREGGYGELQHELEIARSKLVDPQELEKEIIPLQTQLDVITKALESRPSKKVAFDDNIPVPPALEGNNKHYASEDEEVADLKQTLEDSKRKLKDLMEFRRTHTDKLASENQQLQAEVDALTKERDDLQHTVDGVRQDIQGLVGAPKP